MRSKVSSLVVIAALFGTGLASAESTQRGTRTLTGPAGATGTVTLDITTKQKRNGRSREYAVKFDDLPMQCEGGPTTFSFDGGASIQSGPRGDSDSFGVGVVAKNRRGEVTYSWSYKGEMTGRNTAEGVVRARGKRMPVAEGGRDECATQRLPWTASTTAG